ncbi:unnamed protein product [Sphagnum tenellum]
MREKKSKWSFRDLCQRCIKWFFPSADSAAALRIDVETTNAITSSSGVGSHGFNVLSHTYDVFLNHRGPDVKTTFVAHLYEALCKAGFHPFLDVKSLVKGRHAFKSIDEALNSVRVHVAVFSKGYAESKYCLNELCDMLKSGKLIFPIFLDVEPEHLTRPRHGPFATGFRKHMKRGRQDDIKRWEKALFEVANLTGFRLNEVNGDEAQLLRKVVRAIQIALPVGLLQQVVQHRIGLQGPVIEVVNYLHQVGILGIVGMGGIGKTTLAKEVYNEYAKQQSFERQSFLHDVRASSLLSLQKQLVHELLGEDLKSVEEFHNFFNQILLYQKVLIVIDGIDDKWQFDQLIPSLDKLLMQASDGFQDLAKEVADSCNGLPLALEVMGAYLFDKKAPKHEVIWTESAKSLRVDPGAIDHKLQKMFDISYEGLSSPTDKLMFLDIACSMIGQHESPIMNIWESCILCTCPSSKSPHSSLMRLMDKSLVKLDENKNFQMHAVLRDMGKGVPCISLEWLIIRNCTTLVMLPGNIGRLSKLKLLDLRGCSTLKKLPDSISQLQSLEVLYLSMCINLATLSDNFGNLSKLKEVFLDHCKSLKELPYGFGKLQSLVTFSAEGTSFFHLPNSFSQLLNMETLNLDDCMDLQALPPSISGLVKLRCLWMRNIGLEELPEDFGQLQSLKKLHLNHCKHLKTLPNSFGWLEQLEYLDMSYNPCLEVLPESFGRLKALDYLELQGCSIGGKIVGVYAQFSDVKWARIVVEKGAIIMVHGEDGDETIVVNSEVLNTSKSKDLRMEFLKLNLEKKP